MPNPLFQLPTDLPAQTQRMVALQGQIAATLERIEAAVGADPVLPSPGPAPMWLQLPRQTRTPYDVQAMLVSGTDAGLYSLQVGTALVFSWYMAANDAKWFPLAGLLTLAAGSEVSLNVPSGTGRAWLAVRVVEQASSRDRGNA